jgi:hypothetical protein
VRLFAVALDEHGRAGLHELKRGAPVAVRQFRVDFAAAAPPPTKAAAPPAGVWRGDVEPIGFPFRLGLGGPVDGGLLEFDHAGRWLLTVSDGGLLHAWRTAGGDVDVLPRGMYDGQLLAKPLAVAGVAGGFVVAGRLKDRLVAFHYDLGRRVCKAHLIHGRASAGFDGQLIYSPEHHSLIVPGGSAGWALDLATGARHAAGEDEKKGRAWEAWHAFALGLVLPARLWTIPHPRAIKNARQPVTGCYLEPNEGRLYLWRPRSAWAADFVPLKDGRPALQNCGIRAAQCRGNTLAVQVYGRHGAAGLRLYRGPEGIPLEEYSEPLAFTLSADGEQLARQAAATAVEVRPVAGGPPNLKTRVGGCSMPQEFILGHGWLTIVTAKQHYHLLRWTSGTLELRRELLRRSGPSPTERDALTVSGCLARPGRLGVPSVREFLGYDPERFLFGTAGALTVIADRFGQVVVLDRRREVVGLFIAYRNRLAGWLPDGTCFGPRPITGRPESPDAFVKFGRALRDAEEAGKERP